MASDSFNWDVIIRLATQGAKGSADDLTRVGDAVDRLGREGKISEKTVESNTRAISKLGSSASGAKSGLADLESQAVSLRYANYDLAQSMFTVSAAITAAGVGSVAAFASQERAFADVIRTTTDDVSELESTFRSLSTEIPNSFNELAEIATLGNQLGVSGDQLEAFTKTIAEFSTITGISAEESALAFGKLGNLLDVAPDQYDRLASSIALVGRETAATEQQIISVAGEIAPAAAAAGFTADQVIGLSGALASLKVPPERSRSTLLQFFETLNMAVAAGGDKLDNFATVVGVTSDELSAMVRSGQGAGILEQFLGNVSTADTIEVTQALEALGLAGLRTNPTIRALAGNMDLVNQSLADGKRGWTENTELQRQMEIIMATLSAKWQMFLNAAMNVAAVIGSSVAPAFVTLITYATDLLVGLQKFAESDFGQGFFRIVGAIGAAVAAYTLLRGLIALASAGLLGFVTISRALGGAGIVAGLRGMATSFGLITGSATGATTAVGRFVGVLKLLGRATLVLGVLQVATELIFNFAGSMNFLADVTVNVANFIGQATQKIVFFIGNMVSSVAQLLSAIPGVAAGLQQISSNLFAIGALAPDVASDALGATAFKDWAKSLDTGADSLDGLGDSAGNLDLTEYADGTADWADKLGDVGDSADEAAAEIRTLVDYANDLQSVFSRAFDLRFAGGSTLDAITSTFLTIQEASAESARNIAKMKAEIQGLQSDLSIQKYFLGIAIEYGDTKRAEAIQANIAKLQADLSDKTADLSDEQAKNSKELTGNSKAALANRKQMEGLVQQYQEHLVALASSGLSQAELARRTAELREQFIQQATQLGYSRTEIERYAAAFDDMRLIIDKLPRNITLSVDANPAIQALREYEASINSARANAGRGIALGAISNPTNGAEVRRGGLEASLAAAIARIKELIAAGLVSGPEAIAANNRIQDLVNRLKSGNYYSGGYTGRGGKYEPAGVVHRGEYVVPKEQVNQRTGLPYADALGRLQKGAPGRRGYSGGGYVAPSAGFGGQIASLGPMAQQQFSQLFADNMRVYLDGQRIAQNSSQQYAHSTAQGAN